MPLRARRMQARTRARGSMYENGTKVVAAGVECAQQLEFLAAVSEHDYGQTGVVGLAGADGPHQRERLAVLRDRTEHEQRRAVVAELQASPPRSGQAIRNRERLDADCVRRLLVP